MKIKWWKQDITMISVTKTKLNQYQIMLCCQITMKIPTIVKMNIIYHKIPINHKEFLRNILYWNNNVLLCYNLCRSLSASQFVSNFCLIPALYDKIPAFYADISIFFFHCAGNICDRFPVQCLRDVYNDCAHAFCGWGGRVWSHWRQNHLYECAHTIILVRNLLRQADLLQEPKIIYGNYPFCITTK